MSLRFGPSQPDCICQLPTTEPPHAVKPCTQLWTPSSLVASTALQAETVRSIASQTPKTLTLRFMRHARDDSPLRMNFQFSARRNQFSVFSSTEALSETDY